MQNAADIAWDDLRVLLAVARHRTFLAAGRQLGVSTSTVARRITTLEQRVGIQLVQRAADGARVEAGARPLLALAKRLERDLTVLSHDLTSSGEGYDGLVRISLPDGWTPVVAEVVARFRRLHPETQVELLTGASVADLSRREADVAVRMVRSRSAQVVEARAGEVRFGLYGSLEYLRAAGVPRTSRQLPRHDFVGYQARQPEMQWLRERGARRFPFRASSGVAVLAGALADQGLAVLPRLVAVQHPRLQEIELGDGPPPPPSRPVHVAVHRDLRNVRRVRELGDALRAALAERLSRQ
jgi:DNA-binding transcriptional LysR family regulator